MKSNFKDTFPKMPSEVPKGLLKKAFTHPNILVTVHFHSHADKRSFGPSKSITKKAINLIVLKKNN